MHKDYVVLKRKRVFIVQIKELLTSYCDSIKKIPNSQRIYFSFQTIYSPKLLILLGWILVCFGCAKKEVILRIPMTSLPQTFDYNNDHDFTSVQINKNIFGSLLDVTGEQVSYHVAEYWHSLTDTLIYIKLKKNIRFSDGSLLTPTDVQESLARAINHPKTRFIDTLLADVLVGEDHSIQLVLNRSPGNILDFPFVFLSRAGIYKSEYLAKGDDFLRDNPLSIGEYYLINKFPQKMVLGKNRYHFNYKQNQNSPDLIEIYEIPDENQHYQLLKENKIDFIKYLPLMNYNEVMNNNQYSVIDTETNYITLLNMNAHAMIDVGNRLQKNPLHDVRVRLAIAHATNINSFIQETLFNKGIPLAVPLTKTSQMYPVHLEPYSFNLELGETLMRSAGYAQGFNMQVNVVDGKYSLALAQLLQENLSKININVNYTVLDVADMITYSQQKLPSAMIYTTTQYASEQQLLKQLYTDSQTSLMKNNNEEINELLNWRATFEDNSEEVVDINLRLMDKIYETAFVLPLLNLVEPVVLSNYFTFEGSDPYRFINFRINR